MEIFSEVMGVLNRRRKTHAGFVFKPMSQVGVRAEGVTLRHCRVDIAVDHRRISFLLSEAEARELYRGLHLFLETPADFVEVIDYDRR